MMSVVGESTASATHVWSVRRSAIHTTCRFCFQLSNISPLHQCQLGLHDASGNEPTQQYREALKALYLSGPMRIPTGNISELEEAERQNQRAGWLSITMLVKIGSAECRWSGCLVIRIEGSAVNT